MHERPMPLAIPAPATTEHEVRVVCDGNAEASTINITNILCRTVSNAAFDGLRFIRADMRADNATGARIYTLTFERKWPRWWMRIRQALRTLPKADRQE